MWIEFQICALIYVRVLKIVIILFDLNILISGLAYRGWGGGANSSVGKTLEYEAK